MINNDLDDLLTKKFEVMRQVPNDASLAGAVMQRIAHQTSENMLVEAMEKDLASTKRTFDWILLCAAGCAALVMLALLPQFQWLDMASPLFSASPSAGMHATETLSDFWANFEWALLVGLMALVMPVLLFCLED